MTNFVKIAIAAMVCATALGWGFFIWPTPYRYEKVTRPLHNGQSFDEVYQVNRFTGRTKRVLTPYSHFRDSSLTVSSP